ncbi:MAG TPA: DUF882 domain-containing protein [Vicinamibacteria bacterium]|jgi:uncharacterized protein YcbK (DUF882 family)
MERRSFLAHASLAAAGTLLARSAQADPVRELSFVNTHTGEKVTAAYFEHGRFEPDALRDIDRVLRDHRSGEIKPIDRRLLDLLDSLHGKLETSQPYHVISGYRSASTNALLHAASDGVARHSLHMDGKAIDIRIPGVQLAHLRGAALEMGRGGVGYYPSSDFVHVDTGRIRRW